MHKILGSLAALAAIHARMRAGESGFGTYHINGVEKYIAFAPVEGTDSWSLAITAHISDFMDTTIQNIIIIAVLVVVVVVAGVMVTLPQPGQTAVLGTTVLVIAAS